MRFSVISRTADDRRSGRGPGPALVCEAVSKRFGPRLAVDSVDLEIGEGEVFGLVGPNGAGKTTLLSMVCGILEPDRGRVLVGGVDTGRSARAARANLGYVPQEIALYPELTARQNLSFFGSLYGLHGRTLRARVDDALAAVRLEDRGRDRVHDLSGGMRRRANIAAALVHRPALLVLDEPTVGVDPQSRQAIFATLEELVSAGTAMLFTSHQFDEVERLSRRVGIIDGGRILAQGSRSDLVRVAGSGQIVETKVSGGADGPHAVAERFAGALRRRDDVRAVEVAGEEVRFTAEQAVDAVRLLSRLAESHGATLVDVHVATPDLESVFLDLTGRSLRP